MAGLTTDAALAAIHRAGWKVNNLIELDGGVWRANLRRPDGKGQTEYVDFAEAATPAEALWACVKRLGGLPAVCPACQGRGGRWRAGPAEREWHDCEACAGSGKPAPAAESLL